MLTHEIQKVRDELQHEKQRADRNSDEATVLHSKCQELGEKLRQSEQEVIINDVIIKSSLQNECTYLCSSVKYK